LVNIKFKLNTVADPGFDFRGTWTLSMGGGRIEELRVLGIKNHRSGGAPHGSAGKTHVLVNNPP